MFLASTVREVQTVGAIDDHEFTDSRPVSERTAKAAAERIRTELRS